jgi:uncharacterized membrane protein (DUF106 family)
LKRTCAKCYQKYEEEDMVLNKSNAYSFCVECHKKYKEEREKKDKEWNKKMDKEKKELQEVKYPMIKALFPYFLTTLIIFGILLLAWWYRGWQIEVGKYSDD